MLEIVGFGLYSSGFLLSSLIQITIIGIYSKHYRLPYYDKLP